MLSLGFKKEKKRDAAVGHWGTRRLGKDDCFAPHMDNLLQAEPGRGRLAIPVFPWLIREFLDNVHQY